MTWPIVRPGLLHAAGLILPVDGVMLVPFERFEGGELSLVEPKCTTRDGMHREHYRIADDPLPPEEAVALKDMLRKTYGKNVGKILCHIAECRSCPARDVRYGVLVRVQLDGSLAVEREFGVKLEEAE